MSNPAQAPNLGDLHDEQIVALLRSGAHAMLLSAYFGEQEYRELCQYAKLAATRARSARLHRLRLAGHHGLEARLRASARIANRVAPSGRDRERGHSRSRHTDRWQAHRVGRHAAGLSEAQTHARDRGLSSNLFSLRLAMRSIRTRPGAARSHDRERPARGHVGGAQHGRSRRTRGAHSGHAQRESAGWCSWARRTAVRLRLCKRCARSIQRCARLPPSINIIRPNSSPAKYFWRYPGFIKCCRRQSAAHWIYSTCDLGPMTI